MQVTTLLFWTLTMVIGFALAFAASRRALSNVVALAEGLSLPRFFVGSTLLAIGTDLPEMANSIVSCLAGHGDINLGDSVGSSMTQATLVLGLLPFVGGGMKLGGRRISVIGTATIAALGFGALLYSDGYLSRLDALLLLASWLAGTWAVHRFGPHDRSRGAATRTGVRTQVETSVETRHRMSRHALMAFLFLGLVAAGATLAVNSFIRISPTLGVPEYLLTFFVAAIGTSLPELVVNIGALRRGETDLAAGGVLGSSLVDASLSIAVGVLVAPVAITADLAMRGALASVIALAVVTLVLTLAGRHNRITGLLLIVTYLSMYPLLLR